MYPGWELAEQLTPVVDEARPDPALRELYARMLAFFNRAYEQFAPLFDELREMRAPDRS